MKLPVMKLPVMKLPVIVLGALILTSCILANPVSAESKEVRKIEQRFALGDARQVHINMPYGEMRVEGSEGSEVSVEITLTCSRESFEKCKKRADRLRLAPKVEKGELKIKLKRSGRGAARGIHANAVFRVPANMPLEIDQQGSDVFVKGMRADLRIGALAGDVDVVGVREQTLKVDVDVGIGDAELFLGDGSIEGAGFPKKLRWNGPGTALIKVNLGTGDVRVRFDEP